MKIFVVTQIELSILNLNLNIKSYLDFHKLKIIISQICENIVHFKIIFQTFAKLGY